MSQRDLLGFEEGVQIRLREVGLLRVTQLRRQVGRATRIHPGRNALETNPPVRTSILVGDDEIAIVFQHVNDPGEHAVGCKRFDQKEIGADYAAAGTFPSANDST